MVKLNKIIGRRVVGLGMLSVMVGGGLALGLLQLVGERELGGLLLQLGELVLVLGNLFQSRLDAAIVKLSFKFLGSKWTF